MVIYRRLREELVSDNEELLVKLDPFINNLLVLGGLISFFGAIVVALLPGRYGLFIVWDSAIALICAILFALRKVISSKIKLIAINLILLSYGIVSYEMQGIFSSGIFLTMTAIILSQVFLRPIWVVTISLIGSIHGTNVLFRVANGSMNFLGHSEDASYMVSAYMLIYFGVVITIVAVTVSVNALKAHLNDNLIALEQNNKILKDKNEILKDKNREIEYLAYYNQLTTLPNRKCFYRKVNETMSRGDGGTLIVMDLVAFHKVNAFYGMETGDKILHKLAVILKEHITKASHIGYMGNNTIAIWLAFPIEESDLFKRYQHYRNQVRMALELDFNLDAYLVGIARGAQTNQVEDIYTIAEKTIKYLKRHSQRKILYVSEEEYKDVENYDFLVDRIRKAITNKDFKIYYQEKVHTDTGTTIGLEALARLEDETGCMSPGVFVPIIEDNNLATAFGGVIMDKVFEELPLIKQSFGQDIVVSINVSPQQLTQTRFTRNLEKSLRRFETNPKSIELEITENILLSDLEQTSELLKGIRSLGVGISIDDFGTGYSSLKYVSELPIDVLKIDKSFIDRIVEDLKDRAVVKAIIDIAHATGIMIVAEGVEQVAQVRVLRDIGCKVIQGYIYSKPQPIHILLKANTDRTEIRKDDRKVTNSY